MQQRRLRLGDILDDYCPRERRITNHAVVAMIEDEVRQTRCTTCDADHEYKQAKVPTSRRKKPGELLPSDLLDLTPPAPSLSTPAPVPPASDVFVAPPVLDDEAETDVADVDVEADQDADGDVEPAFNDEGPVHRRLIRATLPRPEGQTPERKAPDFTIRQPGGGRFDQQRGNGGNPGNNPGNSHARHRGRPQGRPPQGQANGQHGQPARFGGPRHGAGQGGAPNGQRQGNRSGGNAPGQRGSRPAGPNRGPRQGGQGRKRGR